MGTTEVPSEGGYGRVMERWVGPRDKQEAGAAGEGHVGGSAKEAWGCPQGPLDAGLDPHLWTFCSVLLSTLQPP